MPPRGRRLPAEGTAAAQRRGRRRRQGGEAGTASPLAPRKISVMLQALFNSGPLQKVRLYFTASVVPRPLQSQVSPAPEVPDFPLGLAAHGIGFGLHLPHKRFPGLSWTFCICFVLQGLDQETEGFCFHQTGSLVDLRPASGCNRGSRCCVPWLERRIIRRLSWSPAPCIPTWDPNISDADQNLPTCSGSRPLESFSALYKLPSIREPRVQFCLIHRIVE